MTPYEKVLNYVKSEGVIVEEKFVSSVQHPCEQFQLALYECEKKLFGTITVPKFTDESDFTKAVRLARCYALFRIAQKSMVIKRSILFFDSYITNLARNNYAWKECEKILQETGVIEKPEILPRKNLYQRVFYPKYLYTEAGREFQKIKEAEREYFNKKYSLKNAIVNYTRPVVNWIVNLIRLYIGLGLLAVLHKENYPIPYVSYLFDQAGTEYGVIFNLWYSMALIYTIVKMILFSFDLRNDQIINDKTIRTCNNGFFSSNQAFEIEEKVHKEI
ncbi:hypothetical protein MOD62_16175 [Bacillus spizizenii]|nr:hypothetical protein [Bacillus spizizenii]MCY8635274.1 hypothetical protein [Bacillus spizizenii]